MTVLFDTAVVNEGGADPVIESLNITPTAQQQNIEAPSGVDGYSPITVAAAPQPVIQSLSVTPSSSQQVIEAPSGVDGYSPITVAAVTEPDVTFEFHAAAQAETYDPITDSYTTATRPATGILHLNRGYFENTMHGEDTHHGEYPVTINELFFANSDIIVTVNNGDFVFKGECSIYDGGDDIYDSSDDVFKDGLLGQKYIDYTTYWEQTYKRFYPAGSCRVTSYDPITTSTSKGFMYAYNTEIAFMEYQSSCNKGYSFDITVNQDGSFSFSNFEYIPEEFS